MKNLLVIGYVWPEPRSSAAGSRMLQLLSFFKDEGYQITFATTASETEAMIHLPSRNITPAKIELNSSSFDDFLVRIDPHIVLFDRFMMEEQFGWRVSKVCPSALKILDTEDLHFFRKARQEAFKKDVPLTKEILQSEISKREIASIYRCDMSLIISEVEMDLLQNEFGVPGFLLFHLPFMENIPSENEINALPKYEERKHFISIGNFLHDPNWDAVQNLKQHVWPLIRKQLPTAELHIYGAYPSQKVQQLHNLKEGFNVKGRALSALEVISNSRVLLAPLRFGAGLKGKFIDAMKAGTPTVSTSLGVEGMSWKGNWNGEIADDPVNFAKAGIQLYTEKERWTRAQKNGYIILKNKFSKDLFIPNFRDSIKKLLQGLEEHRRKNFTGSILQHHYLASTRHLSRYIELKNKIKKDNNLKDRS